MSNKASAIDFLKNCAAGNIRPAYEKHVHPDFKHHNAWFKGDRETLMRGMEDSNKDTPNKQFDVMLSAEEGDLVITFSRLRRKADAPEIAVMHGMRFKDGKIVEMWDAGQEVPKDSPNENGMF